LLDRLVALFAKLLAFGPQLIELFLGGRNLARRLSNAGLALLFEIALGVTEPLRRIGKLFALCVEADALLVNLATLLFELRRFAVELASHLVDIATAAVDIVV
jgi:hypothetical protein